jgi:hypothetical protein
VSSAIKFARLLTITARKFNAHIHRACLNTIGKMPMMVPEPGRDMSIGSRVYPTSATSKFRPPDKECSAYRHAHDLFGLGHCCDLVLGNKLLNWTMEMSGDCSRCRKKLRGEWKKRGSRAKYRRRLDLFVLGFWKENFWFPTLKRKPGQKKVGQER